MVRANPALPQRYLRRAGVDKVPDYKLKQFVKGLPRLSGAERKELFEKQLRTSYVPDSLRRHIDTLKHGGAGANHEDADVRFAIQHYANGGDLGREQVEKVMRGLLKITDDLNREGGGRVRFRSGLTPRSSHLEEDARKSAKVIARQGMVEKERESLETAREQLARRKLRADMRDPEKRKELLRPGAGPSLGSSVVSKETPQPSGLGSIASYKPGGPDNPANRGAAGSGSAGTPTNPANAGGPMPFAGFHGVPSQSHSAGNPDPGEAPTHVPTITPGSNPAGPVYTPTAPTVSEGSAKPPAIPADEKPTAPPLPVDEPKDLEIG
jgi:hypothetical protein